MVIGIDGNEANVKSRVGIGAYSYAVIQGLSKLANSETTIRIYLKDKPLPDMPKGAHISYEIVKPRFLWTQVGLPFFLFREKKKPDVFFSPSHYAPRFSPVPTVISVMDLSFRHFPETFAKKDLMQLESWTAYSVKQAALVLTISEASKSDIIKTYSISKDRVVVTYPGIRTIVSLEPKVYSSHMLENSYNIQDPYFLFVGTLQPRKNIEKLIESFSLLLKKTDKKNTKLVIVGKKGWLYEEIFKAPEKFGVEKNVLFLDFVKDEDLPMLYKHALGYVLPSLYEGFGLPVLEAMKYECPVITSNVSSLPEAGGDACLYVDPKSAQDIADKMQMLLRDEKLRKSQIAKGLKQVEKFSWDTTAKETLAVLQDVVKNK